MYKSKQYNKLKTGYFFTNFYFLMINLNNITEPT